MCGMLSHDAMGSLYDHFACFLCIQRGVGGGKREDPAVERLKIKPKKIRRYTNLTSSGKIAVYPMSCTICTVCTIQPVQKLG
jgi:hypothetical protein